MHSAIYLWTTPFWLAWYICVSIKARSANVPDAALHDGNLTAEPLA
jgi:hypothetical protein